MKKTNFSQILFVALGLIGAPALGQSLKEGVWRGTFKTASGTEVPFNFDVRGQGTQAQVFLLNGEERFPTGTPVVRGDSVFIPLEQFDNELAFKLGDAHLSGVLRKKDLSGRTTPVEADFGRTDRFAATGEKPVADISGTYDIVFKSPAGKEEKAVGVFKQQGSKLVATFLRVTGDSRYLEGIVSGNAFYLSSFIGSGPGYHTGTISASGELTGTSGGQAFTGIRNAAAALPNPYTLTYLKEGYSTFDFSLPDLDGKKISLKDDKYKNKVVIVTITGTWCPNCIDEAAFLAPWYKKNKNRGVEAIGVHYERKTDAAYLRNAIGNFRKRFGIEYDEVIGGLPDKRVVAESFPALNTFLSFPTILFIDKKGNVDKIYTGFTGPATGKYYEQFVKEFNEEVDKLLAAN